ncbi:hypothetical protein [Streptomyces sp. NPDC058735]|uniref:hypothetical protein n=1 Tax=unclassified Streptomyces TaxID=2593676 RepID=UPI0036950425
MRQPDGRTGSSGEPVGPGTGTHGTTTPGTGTGAHGSDCYGADPYGTGTPATATGTPAAGTATPATATGTPATATPATATGTPATATGTPATSTPATSTPGTGTGLPGGEGTPGPGSGTAGADGNRPHLFPHDETDKLGAQLHHAVAVFVDGPRAAVEEADHVLEEIAARFTEAVAQRRRALRHSWQSVQSDGGGKPVSSADTEQLRLALKDYRELAERLMHV